MTYTNHEQCDLLDLSVDRLFLKDLIAKSANSTRPQRQYVLFDAMIANDFFAL